MTKPYEIVLSMRRGTADWISDVLDRDGVKCWKQEVVTTLARGLVVSKTRARLSVPYDQELLANLRAVLWGLIGTAPYGVACSLERLCKDIESAVKTPIVDHLVKYMSKASLT